MVQTTAVDERHAVTSGSPLAVGVVVWLASEVMFFAGLFAAWFVLRSQNDPWPMRGIHLETARAAVFTVVLVLSSGTMHVAARAAEAGHRARTRRWMGLTILLGTLFALNQALEYHTLDFQLSTNAYGTIYYLITGFHLLHVIGGLVLMAVVAGVALSETSKAPLGSTTVVTSYYWHFVDVVWVVVFLMIFVLQ